MPLDNASTSPRPIGGEARGNHLWVSALTVAALVGAAVLVSLTAPFGGHRELSGREWQRLAANPAAYVGEQLVVHGVVTRPGTGTERDVVEAAVDGLDQLDADAYTTPAELRGADPLLAAGDTFRADVTVQAPDGKNLVLRVDGLWVLDRAQ